MIRVSSAGLRCRTVWPREITSAWRAWLPTPAMHALFTPRLECTAPGGRPSCDPTIEARPGMSSPCHSAWVATRMDAASASALRSTHTTRIFCTSVRAMMACNEVPIVAAPGRASQPFPLRAWAAPAPHHTHAGVSFVLFDPRVGPGNTPTPTVFVAVADPGPTSLVVSSTPSRQRCRQPRTHCRVRAHSPSTGSVLDDSDGIGPDDITDGAVFALETTTSSWRNITPPRPAGGFMGLAVDAQHPDTLLAATVDCWMGRDTILAKHGRRATLGKPAAAQ